MERHRLHISGATHPKASDYNCLFHKKIREYGIDNFELIQSLNFSYPTIIAFKYFELVFKILIALS